MAFQRAELLGKRLGHCWAAESALKKVARWVTKKGIPMVSMKGASKAVLRVTWWVELTVY